MLRRQSLSDFILGGRGLLRLLAIAAIAVACKAEGGEPNYN